MKDLVDKLLASLPTYARQLVALLSGPRRFAAALDLDSDRNLQDALTFLAVSFGLAYIAQIPLMPASLQTLLGFGTLAIQAGFSLLLIVAILVLAWRMVGSRLAWRKLLILSCYFSGISTLISLGVGLIATGLFMFLDPVTCKAMLNGKVLQPQDWANSLGTQVYVALLGLGLVAIYVWVWWVWGAYRRQTQLSKMRSAIAFAVFVLLSPVVFFVEGAMQKTIMPAPDTAPPPPELVGDWTLIRPRAAAHFPETIYYSFRGDGTYCAGHSWSELPVPNQRCTNIFVESECGRYGVKDNTITLTPGAHIQSVHETCSGKESKKNLPLSPAVAEYRIKRESTGWQLCLSDRFGENCLTPKQ